ncbi:MAG: HAD-IB family hydrolase [Flavobacterium psychrophilum]|jgi:phosphatidylglycerophosphatase C|nr:MAG: HAD-IB family hydrolase [Flavobacterium psychrophilum]
MKKGLALFDFDGTLTTKDTLLEIVKYQKGELFFYFGFFLLSPVMVLYKLKLIKNWRAKEIMLGFFFGGDSIDKFQRKCEDFVAYKLHAILRPEAIKKLKEHLANNDRVVVVTASSYNWVAPWCKAMNVELIATQLQVKDNHLTGKLETRNCYGVEKANRINAFLNLADYSPVYAYGDTRGDKEMLALAEFPFYRKF